MATEHGFLINCLHCGRIACEKESAEVCFACGSDPRVRPRQNNPVAVFFEGGSDSLLEGSHDASSNEEIESAIKRRNEILERQRDQERQLKVYDTKTDYFPPASVDKELENFQTSCQTENLSDKTTNPSIYQVQIDYMNQSVSVCANIQSSIINNSQAESDKRKSVSPTTLAEQAAHRAMHRLRFEQKLDIVNEVDEKRCDNFHRIHANPFISQSHKPLCDFSFIEFPTPHGMTLDEKNHIERKLKSLQNVKKVSIDM